MAPTPPPVSGGAAAHEAAELFAEQLPPGLTLLTGQAGSGKTTLLIGTALERVRATGRPVLFLSASRQGASRTAEELGQGLEQGLGGSRSFSWPALSFDILSMAQAQGLIPWIKRTPRLRTGAEQDHLFKELLERVPADSMPPSLREALSTQGLRQQLRDFADQAIQQEADPFEEIEGLAQKHARPEWSLAAQVIRSYRERDALSEQEALDALELSLAARSVLEDHPDFASSYFGEFSTIFVDDSQNLTSPELALLLLIAEQSRLREQPVCVAFDEATTVQAFRGADPRRTGRALTAAGALHLDLGQSRRLSGAIGQVYAELSRRLGATLSGAPAALLGRADQPEPRETAVETVVLGHQFHEHRYIATRIIDLVLGSQGELSFGDIAVVVRAGATARSIERQLVTLGVPVDIPPAVLTLKDTPAARPLVEAMKVVVDPEALDPLVADELLTSSLVGMTSVDVRRMRKILRRRERERLSRTGEFEQESIRVRLSDELLLEALRDPALAEGVPGAERLSTILAEGRRAYETLNRDPQHVLWALWAASGRAAIWRSEAAGSGRTAERANRDLDAVSSLFYAAERFMDQRPGGTADDFLTELLEQEVPVDTVAKRSKGRSAVALLTPATVAGREFKVVFIAGVQEGQWPNPQIRGELFETSDFLDALSAQREGREFQPSTRRERVAAVKRDELRLFMTAVSRATTRLILTAVQGEEEAPSVFFDLVALAAGTDISTRQITVPPRPQSLRALVGELRQKAESGEGDLASDAAAVLATIAEASDLPEAALADPQRWWAARPLSSTGPILPPDALVSVSPSKVELALKDPLGWFIQSIGGEPAVEFSRQVGTLIHGIAERHPDALLEQMTAELETAWAEMHPVETVTSIREKATAEHLLKSLAQYVREATKEGRSFAPGNAEVRFALPLTVENRQGSRAVEVRGSIDRLEQTAEGGWVVVDLKTGKTAVTAKEAETHPQMAIYQLAAGEGVLPGVSSSDAALLVYLGKDNVRKVTTVRQDAAGTADLARELISRAVEVMTGSEFRSVEGAGRHRSQLPDVDPLMPQGRPVTRRDDPSNDGAAPVPRTASESTNPTKEGTE